MQAGATITPKEEPATSGKIILFTTNGQIQIQLWAKQMPLACRNFVQHCLDGYYDSTIFHRMIPGFMIQGGDPTGTGSGGQSIYKQPFKNQYHQKIKFGRRGMVAMANSGKDINKSQFFMTFGECNHLNKDHTIFGKVVGDSIYNLLSYQSLDTQKGTDRPTDPPYIRKTKVVDNPFEDLVPRVIKPEKEVEPQKAQEPKKKINKTQMKKLKNKKRLTFQDEDEEVEQTKYRIKSSHDMLNDDKLSKQVAITAEQLELKRKQKQQEEKKKQELIDRVNQAANNKDNQPTNKSISKMLDDQLHRKKKMADNSSSLQIQDEILNYKKTLNSQTGKIQIHWGKDQPIQQVQQEHQDSEQKMKHLRQLQQRQYQAMRIDQLNFKQLKEGTLKQRRKQLVAQEKQLLSNVQKRKYQFLKKQKMAEREDPLFDKLQKFKGRLAINKPNDWMCHKLKFHIDSQNAYDLDKKNKERQLRDQQQQD